VHNQATGQAIHGCLPLALSLFLSLFHNLRTQELRTCRKAKHKEVPKSSLSSVDMKFASSSLLVFVVGVTAATTSVLAVEEEPALSLSTTSTMAGEPAEPSAHSFANSTGTRRDAVTATIMIAIPTIMAMTTKITTTTAIATSPMTPWFVPTGTTVTTTTAIVSAAERTVVKEEARAEATIAAKGGAWAAKAVERAVERVA
jgi:hypothetical protein